jgi:hypothetical protein
MAKKIQWHPLFARLLRPYVEGYYEVQTDVPVGDLPRQADIVLLRRTGTGSPPFRGLWRHLTPWDVQEFKGPTVSPRAEDIPLLVEVGLGITRRLRTQQRRQRGRPLPADDMSFWYLANRSGRRFLRDAEGLLGGLECPEPGVWRARILSHPCLLVSTVDLTVDADSLPLHVLGQEPPALEREVGRFVVEDTGRLSAYADVFSLLHPSSWEEVKSMAKGSRKQAWPDPAGVRNWIEWVGPEHIIELIGKREVVRKIGTKEVLEELDVDDILANLPPAKRRALKRRLEETGG